jgi:hypothetical protein
MLLKPVLSLKVVKSKKKKKKMSNAPKQLNFWIAEILPQGLQNNII